MVSLAGSRPLKQSCRLDWCLGACEARNVGDTVDVLVDLTAESDDLDAMVADLDEPGWLTATPAAGWSPPRPGLPRPLVRSTHQTHRPPPPRQPGRLNHHHQRPRHLRRLQLGQTSTRLADRPGRRTADHPHHTHQPHLPPPTTRPTRPPTTPPTPSPDAARAETCTPRKNTPRKRGRQSP